MITKYGKTEFTNIHRDCVVKFTNKRGNEKTVTVIGGRGRFDNVTERSASIITKALFHITTRKRECTKKN